jgi:hypothetical protein
VPVARNDFEPVRVVKAAFYGDRKDTEAGSGVSVSLQATFSMTMPSINLVNFNSYIKTFTCLKDDTLILEMNDVNKANEAALVWKRGLDRNDFGLFLGQEYSVQCAQSLGQMGKGEGHLTKKVIRLSRKHETITLTTKQLPVEKLISSYEIQFENRPTKFKEGLLDDWVHGRFDGKKLSIGVNYNPDTASAHRAVPIYANKIVDISCSNCWVAGELVLNGEIKGTTAVVNTFGMQITGGLVGQIELKMAFFDAQNKDLIRSRLAAYAFNPMSIPGILSLSPELVLDASVTYSITTGTAITTGASLTLPVGVRINSPFGRGRGVPLFSKVPGIDLTPKLDVIKPKFTRDASKPVEARVAAHLTPKLQLAMTIFKLVDVRVGAEFDNELGLALVTPNSKMCPDADKPTSLGLYHNHRVGLSIQAPSVSENVNLWELGARPIKCRFCNVCLPGLPFTDADIVKI